MIRNGGIKMKKNNDREKILFYGTILTDAGSDEIEAADAKIYRDKYTDEYKKFKKEFDGTPYTTEYNRVCKKYEAMIKWLDGFVEGE